MNTQELLIQGALANIGEKDWKGGLAINILEKYLDDRKQISW